MHMDPCSVAPADAAPPFLLDPLHALTQLQQRADLLRDEMAALRRRIARRFDLVEADDAVDADRSGHGTIVVAQDHPALRSIAAEILEGLGYRVLLGDSRMAGVPADMPIDAILLDVPLVNEERLACVRNAGQRSPRVVVATSLPEGPGRQRLREAGVVGFVAWPLETDEVARCLHWALISDRANPM
jgi:CheY-like chemotaxis protein